MSQSSEQVATSRNAGSCEVESMLVGRAADDGHEGMAWHAE